jgi:methylenetetrahydrofolate dehydrogenase (NADP+)/methenyltetrahydrofolate cyclohydrolase
MKCTIIDGTALAADIKEGVKSSVAKINAAEGAICFAAILVGSDPASVIYVGKKQRECEAMGIAMQKIEMPEQTKQKELNNTIKKLSRDKSVHGILLQLPLPKGLNAGEAIENIAPSKDVDGLTCSNFGRLAQDNPVLAPCTALGIMHILERYNIAVEGSRAVVIGRSNIVGKPTAMMLTQKNATVTLAHSRTKNLAELTRTADIVIAAVGKQNLITADMVKKGATIIDVGTNRLPDGKLCGDVDFEAIKNVAGAITPVPGGVGPLTIAFLLKNIVTAYQMQTKRIK